MFRSYRNVITTIVGIGILAFLGGWGLDRQANYQKQAAERHAEYTADAANEMKQACRVTVAAEIKNCLLKAISEYRLKSRDNERDYSDLVAQQTSSLWTAIMGVAALIGMILSAIGVALVWITFRETKSSNEIAQKAFDYQVRPWIKVRQEIGRPTFTDSDISVTLEITCINVGSSPANRVSILSFILVDDWPTEIILNNLPSLFEEGNSEWHERTIFPNEDWKRGVSVECTGVVGLHDKACVVVAARYTSPANYTKFYYTANVYDFVDAISGNRDVLRDLATTRVSIMERESFPSHAS